MVIEKIAASIALAAMAVGMFGVVAAIVTAPERAARHEERVERYIEAKCMDATTHADRLRWCERGG